jgi:mono/diheme cytochrome c family protein
MAAAIFLGFFLILGLGVVGVAMRGGPRGVRDTLEVGRKRPLHAVEFAVAGAVMVFGLAVPAVVLLGDQASAGPGGTKLSSTEKAGRVLFAEKCATCHTLKDAGAVGKVGPDLDVLAPNAKLTISVIEQGRAGNGQMPAQLLEEDEAKKVAAYLVDVAGR